MFNKKKRVKKAFELIAKFIDKCNLPADEKRILKGLLKNIEIRSGVA